MKTTDKYMYIVQIFTFITICSMKAWKVKNMYIHRVLFIYFLILINFLFNNHTEQNMNICRVDSDKMAPKSALSDSVLCVFQMLFFPEMVHYPNAKILEPIIDT